MTYCYLGNYSMSSNKMLTSHRKLTHKCSSTNVHNQCLYNQYSGIPI